MSISAFSEMLQSLASRLLISIIRWSVKFPSHQFIRQILLFHIMLREIMGIELANAMSQLLRPAVMLVLQMNRHCRSRGLHRFHSLKDGITCRITLGR